MEKKMSCIAVDDEPFALKLIAEDISKVPFLDLKGTFSSPMDALTFMQKEPLDLLFLDIQMPVLTGTQFLRTLKDPPMVIFTTAYDQYALEGFELNVVDYLMKPIPFDRFLKAANKAFDLFKLKSNAEPPAPKEPGFFFVHSEYREIKIFYDDILYIEGLKDYVKIFTDKQVHPILTRLNLKAVEGKLPSTEFARIHNSFIVPLKRIKSFQKSQVFIGTTAIPIGEKYAEEFRRVYVKA
jgi:DNA-binding LytR/AlgR family response regulator